MNGILNKILCACGASIVVLLAVYACTGCATVRPIEQSVIEHSRNVERSIDANRELTDIIDKSAQRVDAIGEQAAGIGDAIKRLEYLIREYELEVCRILTEVNDLRAKIGEADDNAGCAVGNPCGNDACEVCNSVFEN